MDGPIGRVSIGSEMTSRSTCSRELFTGNRTQGLVC